MNSTTWTDHDGCITFCFWICFVLSLPSLDIRGKAGFFKPIRLLVMFKKSFEIRWWRRWFWYHVFFCFWVIYHEFWFLRLIGVVLLMYFEIVLLVVAYVMSSAYLGFISIDDDILMFFVSFFRLSDKYKMNRIALRQSPCMIPTCVINSVLVVLL